MLTVVTDYVVQGARFIVFEQYGCSKAEDASVVSLLLVDIWTPVIPFISATFYARKLHPSSRFTRLIKILHSSDSVAILPPAEGNG